MVNFTKVSKIVASVFAIFFLLVLFIAFSWLVILPALISNTALLNKVEKSLESSMKADIEIVKPVLKTSLMPHITFKLDRLKVSHNNTVVLNISNLDSNISFSKIFSKRIVINKLGADFIYIDVNKLISLIPGQEKKEDKKSQWRPDLFNSLLYVKKCIVLYDVSENTKIKFDGSDLEITAERNPKYVHFNVVLDIIKNIYFEYYKNKIKINESKE